MSVSIAQNSFVGGEWAQSLYGRTDLAKYSTAARQMKNAFPHPHGGGSNRGGMEFIAETKTSAKTSRLVPFEFSVVQAYVLEFGHQYFRVYKDGAIVLDGSSNIYEVATTYTEADLQLLKFTQSADVLYVTHPSYKPRKISRTGHAAWTITDVSFGSTISAPGSVTNTGGSGAFSAYYVTAVDSEGEESVQSSSTSGYAGCQISWAAVSGADYYNVYKDGHSSGVAGWIGQATGTGFTETAGGINPDYSKTPPKNRTPFSGAGKYPGCATFFEQRLVYGRNDEEPQTVWGSVIGSFDNMNVSSPIKDNDAYKFTINSRQMNEIRWLVAMNDLLIGTSGGEWRMTAGGGSDSVTPTSVKVKQQSQWGVSDLQPIVAGSTVLFVDRSDKKIRDLLYSFEADGYVGNDLTLLANHLFTDYLIMDWCYQQSPDSIVWVVRDDGVLLGLTYYKEQEVWGWHRHETDGEFEAVASIPTATGETDVYCIVRRLINGSYKRYVERFRPRLPQGDDYIVRPDDSYFVDSGLTYDGWNYDAGDTMALTGGTTWGVGEALTLTASGHTPFSNPGSIGKYFKLRSGTDSVIVQVTGYTSTTVTTVKAINRPVPTALRTGAHTDWAIMATTFSGLGHLEAKSVNVLADGNVIKNLTVSSGAITLANPAAKVHAGLGYESDIETLDFEYPTQTGTVQDKPRSIQSVMLRLEKTRALFVGPSEDRLIEVPFRENEDYGEPIELFSGDKEVFIERGDTREGRVFIRNTDPLPFTVLALVARMDNGEE